MSTTDDDRDELLRALTEILTVFDDDPQMTEDLLSIEADQHTAESHALATIREIGRRVMEGRGTATGATAEDHVRAAERFAAAAEGVEDVTGYERQLRRSADLQAAQVHATLAQTLKATELMPLMARMTAWLASSDGESAP